MLGETGCRLLPFPEIFDKAREEDELIVEDEVDAATESAIIGRQASAMAQNAIDRRPAHNVRALQRARGANRGIEMTTVVSATRIQAGMRG